MAAGWGPWGFLCTVVAGSDSGLGQAPGKVLPGTLLGLCLPLAPAATEAPQAARPGTRVGAHPRVPARGWRPPDRPRTPLWTLASSRPLAAARIVALGTRSCSGMGLSWPGGWGCLLLSPDSLPRNSETGYGQGKRLRFLLHCSETRRGGDWGLSQAPIPEQEARGWEADPDRSEGCPLPSTPRPQLDLCLPRTSLPQTSCTFLTLTQTLLPHLPPYVA